jgi:hypothetical protein
MSMASMGWRVEFSGVDESDHRNVDLGVAVFAQEGMVARQMIRRRGRDRNYPSTSVPARRSRHRRAKAQRRR